MNERKYADGEAGGQRRVSLNSLESYANRTEHDAQHLEAMQVARALMARLHGTETLAELDAIETISAAATALEHQHPAMDEVLARKLRWCVNLLLHLDRFNGELISQINELDGSYAKAESSGAGGGL